MRRFAVTRREYSQLAARFSGPPIKVVRMRGLNRQGAKKGGGGTAMPLGNPCRAAIGNCSFAAANQCHPKSCRASPKWQRAVVGVPARALSHGCGAAVEE